ncbi:hypothetical protein HID58_008068 [Brassica napus]|uniref:Uncharacterized protein n=1 Tax=Brassica napus TaxID=3708 RepID=A0ABQ8DR66_BRANA|nr:hypothetical protein HID58_008068 [Brassica napus]
MMRTMDRECCVNSQGEVIIEQMPILFFFPHSRLSLYK